MLLVITALHRSYYYYAVVAVHDLYGDVPEILSPDSSRNRRRLSSYHSL